MKPVKIIPVRVHPAARHPVDPRALFVLVLCVVSGLPLLFGVIEPESIDALLPVWAVIVWGFFLATGAATTLVGMSRQTITGVILEQIGSVTVGCATIFYGVVIALAAGVPGAFAAAIIMAWGAANFWRWMQLQAYLRDKQIQAAANAVARTVAGEEAYDDDH